VAVPGGELAQLDVPVIEPGSDELLIRVEASSINPVDTYIVRGTYRSSDLAYPIVPGFDFSGVVEGVGAAVSGFAVGDGVVGCWSKPYLVQGAWAEYMTVPVSAAVVRRPATLDPQRAAAMPLAALTAAIAIEDVAPAVGDVVLVAGAAGAV